MFVLDQIYRSVVNVRIFSVQEIIGHVRRDMQTFLGNIAPAHAVEVIIYFNVVITCVRRRNYCFAVARIADVIIQNRVVFDVYGSNFQSRRAQRRIDLFGVLQAYDIGMDIQLHSDAVTDVFAAVGSEDIVLIIQRNIHIVAAYFGRRRYRRRIVI